MDICTLLPLSIQNNCANKQINQSQMKQQEMEYIFSNDRHKGKPRCKNIYFLDTTRLILCRRVSDVPE